MKSNSHSNKVAIISDLHFGVRNDSAYFLGKSLKFLKEVFFPTLLKQQIDEVLILGDVFDRRKFVNFQTLFDVKKEFFDVLEANNIKVKILLGNHDVMYKNTNDINSVQLLLHHYSNIQIIPEVEDFVYGNRKICMVSWLNENNIDDFTSRMMRSDAEVCMGHFAIEGFINAEEEKMLPSEMFKSFNQVLSGHFHTRSEKGNILYIGAPYEMTWGDSEVDKGFYLWDYVENEYEFIHNPERLHIKEYYADDSDLSKILETDYSDKVVKLFVTTKNRSDSYSNALRHINECNVQKLDIIESFQEFSSENVDTIIDVDKIDDIKSIISGYIDDIATDLPKHKLKDRMLELYENSQQETM